MTARMTFWLAALVIELTNSRFGFLSEHLIDEPQTEAA
jgi:hypothetical protein